MNFTEVNLFRHLIINDYDPDYSIQLLILYECILSTNYTAMRYKFTLC